MDWGMENRLARILRPDKRRALMLAVDHGYFLGPTERLEDPRSVIAPLLKYCDSLMLSRGVQRSCVDADTSTPMVLRVSGGSSIIGDDLSKEDITVSVQDAIRLNASALAMSIFVGSKYEYQTIVNLGRLVSEAEQYGIPVLAVTAVGKELGKDARYLSLACRIAAEQGAHIVKTYYCDNFEKVVQSCPVPIIVAGGKKIPERDALQLTYNAIKGGAVGVDMGRNIWQSDHPVAMIRAVRSIVHQNSGVQEAFKMYEDLASGREDPGTGGDARPQGGQRRPQQWQGRGPRQDNRPGQRPWQGRQNQRPGQNRQAQRQDRNPQRPNQRPGQNRPQQRPNPSQQKPNQPHQRPSQPQQKPNQQQQKPNQGKPEQKPGQPQQKPNPTGQNPNQNTPQQKPSQPQQNPNQGKPEQNPNTPEQKPNPAGQKPNQGKPEQKPNPSDQKPAAQSQSGDGQNQPQEKTPDTGSK